MLRLNPHHQLGTRPSRFDHSGDICLVAVMGIGNAAGMGAKLALISTSKRAEARALARRVSYVELATQPEFARIFAQAMYLG